MALTSRTVRHVTHATQFVPGTFTGGCTLIALAACNIAINGPRSWVLPGELGDFTSEKNAQELMDRFYHDGRNHGDCAESGGCDPQQIINIATRAGMPIKDQWHAGRGGSWLAFLRQYAGGASPFPVLVQTARGRNLRDALSGASDEASLDFHAYAILGTMTDPLQPQAGGYIAEDGDNAIISERNAVYSIATIEHALPYSMIAFDYPTPPPPAPTAYEFSYEQYQNLRAWINELSSAVSAAKPS